MAATAMSKSQVLLCLSALKNNLKLRNNVNSLRKIASFSTDNRRFYSTENEEKPREKISAAMRIYLERAKEYDAFLLKEQHEFERGKRHLANMMGYDYEQLTQEEIDKSIQYLFPSGLYDKKAKPMMKPPEVIHPARKAAQFDYSGRPFHSLFYTLKPNYFQTFYDIVEKMDELNALEDRMLLRGIKAQPENAINLLSSSWLNKKTLEDTFYEELLDEEYNYFIATMDRLAAHPYSNTIKDFIMKYRKVITSLMKTFTLVPIEYNNEGRPYVHVKGCTRKSARGEVKLWANGTGKITINGKDITYFSDFQAREQVSKHINTRP